MQTRWMLYMEKGETLKIFPGAPRVWFENGKRIELQNVASYFGPLSVNVESRLKEGRIEATVECKDKRRPKRVELRLPHPEGRKATRVEGGVYDAPTESVRVEPFRGRSQMILEF